MHRGAGVPSRLIKILSHRARSTSAGSLLLFFFPRRFMIRRQGYTCRQVNERVYVYVPATE